MFPETHYDPAFSPVVLALFKQNPLKEYDRLTVSQAFKLSLTAAQEHLSNLLIKGKIARTLSYKYVLPEYKEEVENISFIPVKNTQLEPTKYEEDNGILKDYIIKVMKEVNEPVTITKLSLMIGISKFDLELTLMDLINKNIILEVKEIGHIFYKLNS